MGGVREACRAAWEQGPLFRRSWGRYTRCRGLHIRYKRSPWCLKGGKVTVTVTPSLVCPRIRQREYRGMQRHPASKSGPTTGSTAARPRKTRTARKIRILRGYGKYATRIRHRGRRLDMLCRPLHGPLRIDKDAGADLEYFLWGGVSRLPEATPTN